MDALENVFGDGEAAPLGALDHLRPVIPRNAPAQLHDARVARPFEADVATERLSRWPQIDECGNGIHHAADHYICSATLSTPAQ
jgi:hypothetical protein